MQLIHSCHRRPRNAFPKPGFPLDMLRCESLLGLDQATCSRVLNKNYKLLVSMAPLSNEIRPISSCTPQVWRLEGERAEGRLLGMLRRWIKCCVCVVGCEYSLCVCLSFSQKLMRVCSVWLCLPSSCVHAYVPRVICDSLCVCVCALWALCLQLPQRQDDRERDGREGETRWSSWVIPLPGHTPAF